MLRQRNRALLFTSLAIAVVLVGLVDRSTSSAGTLVHGEHKEVRFFKRKLMRQEAWEREVRDFTRAFTLRVRLSERSASSCVLSVEISGNTGEGVIYSDKGFAILALPSGLRASQHAEATFYTADREISGVSFPKFDELLKELLSKATPANIAAVIESAFILTGAGEFDANYEDTLFKLSKSHQLLPVFWETRRIDGKWIEADRLMVSVPLSQTVSLSQELLDNVGLSLMFALRPSTSTRRMAFIVDGIKATSEAAEHLQVVTSFHSTRRKTIVGWSWAIPPRYTGASIFSDGVALVSEKDMEGVGFINTNGDYVVVITPEDSIQGWSGWFSEGLLLVKKDGKLGFVDKSLRMVIEPIYTYARGFSEGLAPVMTGAWGYDKWGYINKAGHLIIEAEYDNAKPFSEGLAAVKINGRWGYIDKAGKMIIPPRWSGQHGAGGFSEGLAVVQTVNVSYNPRDKASFINKKGDIVLPEYEYQFAYSFSDGLAKVRWGFHGRWGFVDKEGNVVIASRFDDARGFEEGVAPVKIEGKWGYIDRTGAFVIKPRFADAGRFRHGLAPVKVGDNPDDRRLIANGGGFGYIRLLVSP